MTGADAEAVDDDRAAVERARYLDRTTDLDRDHARAVALAELGYSDAGVARRLGVAEATATKWLDDVADRYGASAVHPKCADERDDLRPTNTDAPAPDWGADRRRVVLDADADPAGAHLERYYRTWIDEGTVRRQEKVAVRLVEYDARAADRLGALDWDAHHVTWTDDYPLVDGDPGAWTADADADTALALRRAGVPLPPPGDLRLVAEVWPWRPSDGRECPVCHAERICSARDLDAYPDADESTALALVRRSDRLTHVCLACRRLFEAEAEAEADETVDTLAGAM